MANTVTTMQGKSWVTQPLITCNTLPLLHMSDLHSFIHSFTHLFIHVIYKANILVNTFEEHTVQEGPKVTQTPHYRVSSSVEVKCCEVR